MEDLYGALSGIVPRDDNSSNSSLNAGPPANRSAAANHATLLVSWWCTAFALVIILVRLWGRYERTRKFFMEDKIMALSIIPLLIRMAFAHPILLWGTNNINTVDVILSAQQVYHHSLGARLVLPARIFYALFIWTAKFTVSEYLKRLVSSIWTERYQMVLRCIRIFLLVTFFAVVIATLTECTPFDHYWQVIPDPGSQCRNGYAQLLTMGTCDIITDILLIAFPIHLLWKSTMPTKRKLSLSVLFSLSLILIAITSYRMVAIVEARGRQQLRTLWASLEILAAAAVSNALVLGSFLRDRGVKKAKYRGSPRSRSGSTANAEPSINRSMTQQHWGNDSDEDLFKSLRGRLGSVTDTASSLSKVPPLPSQRVAREGSDAESNVLEEETEAEHGEALWRGDGSKDKFIVSRESSSLATSWSSDAQVTHPHRAQTSSIIAHDFASWGSGFPSQQGHDAHSFAEAGRLSYYTPPLAAATNTSPQRNSNGDLVRIGSSSSSTHYAFHTPHRAPRFNPPSPTQQDRVSSVEDGRNLITRTETTLSSTPTLQDAGGLLGAPHVSQPRQHGRLSSDRDGHRDNSLGERRFEDSIKSEENSKHHFLGIGSWRRPSRKETSQTLPLQMNTNSSKRPSQQVDSMDLQDPGGLLG